MEEKQTLFLYDEQMYVLGRVKAWLKFILGRQHRGPQVVVNSLKRGLTSVGVKWILNSPKAGDTVCVLNGVKTLRWAIKQKELKKINRIIVGPNLVIIPKDSEGVLMDPNIDKIIVPSKWAYDLYSQDTPQIKSRCRIWPAGVQVPKLPTTKKSIDFLIYNKIGNNQLFANIIELLQSHKYNFKILVYGKFRQEDYFGLLEQSRYVIYLSESESQGLAMFEAWARNVPVLAWERGFWQDDGYFHSGLSATPYLSAESGMRFRDFDDFQVVLPKFIQAKFSPREYVAVNYSDEICAKKYLTILNEQ